MVSLLALPAYTFVALRPLLRDAWFAFAVQAGKEAAYSTGLFFVDRGAEQAAHPPARRPPRPQASPLVRPPPPALGDTHFTICFSMCALINASETHGIAKDA